MTLKQLADNSWRTTVQNRSETSLKQGQDHSDTTNKLGQGQSETISKLGQVQSETTNKLGQGQNEITNKLIEKEKLAEEEEFFPVFEEQEERLLRMEINCENLLQKQVHK